MCNDPFKQGNSGWSRDSSFGIDGALSSESCKSSRFVNRLRKRTNQSIVVEQSRNRNSRTVRPKTPKWATSSLSSNKIRQRSSVWRFVKEETWDGLARIRFNVKRESSSMKVTCRDGPLSPGRTFSRHFRKLRSEKQILRKRCFWLRWCHADETIKHARKLEVEIRVGYRSSTSPAISSIILSIISWGSSMVVPEFSDAVWSGVFVSDLRATGCGKMKVTMGEHLRGSSINDRLALPALSASPSIGSLRICCLICV